MPKGKGYPMTEEISSSTRYTVMTLYIRDTVNVTEKPSLNRDYRNSNMGECPLEPDSCREQHSLTISPVAGHSQTSYVRLHPFESGRGCQSIAETLGLYKCRETVRGRYFMRVRLVARDRIPYMCSILWSRAVLCASSPKAEAADLSPAQYRFESCVAYQYRDRSTRGGL